MTKKIHQKKVRLPRKLKKAAFVCTSYYDGYMVALPIRKYDRTAPTRHTRAMHRLCDRYWNYWDWENGYDTHGRGHRRGALIDDCLPYIYYSRRNEKWETLKWHRKCGEIFTHCWGGAVYPNGAWVPKVKPGDRYQRACRMAREKDIPESERYWVEHLEYSYEKIGHVRTEKFFITKEEFDDDKTSARRLFMKYMEEHAEEIIRS